MYRLILFGSITGLVTMAIRFYIHNRREISDKYGQYLAAGQKTWLVWPAIGANAFFDVVFGKEIISIRSLLTTLCVSVAANFACVILIFMSFPEDLPPIEPVTIKTLVYSYLWFIGFNFMGDVASLYVTRRCVRKIINREYDLVKYVVIDISGIVLGYLITLLPTILVTLYAILSSTTLNQWVHMGILGNALVPFFLFIFATGGLPLTFGVWAVISVFSITIPTAIYLSLMVLCLIGFKVNMWWLKGKDKSHFELILESIQSFCLRILVPLAAALAAGVAAYKLTGHY